MDATSTPPKITYFALPAAKRPEHPGMVTPPLRPPGNVPFMWEEAPGKPKMEPKLPPEPASKSLEPPPVKAYGAVTSPTTVLDGPYMANKKEEELGLSKSNNGRGRSFEFVRRNSKKKQERDIDGFWSAERKGSGRGVMKRGNGRMSMDSVESIVTTSSASTSAYSSSSSSSASSSVFCSFSPPSSSSSREYCYCKDGVEDEGKKTKVRISRMMRSGSFSGVSSYETSHLWARIFGGLKNALHWRRRRKA